MRIPREDLEELAKIGKISTDIAKYYLTYLGARMIRKTSGLIILWMLSKKRMHGYAIMEEFKKQPYSKGLTASKLYPILIKFEKDGLVKSQKKKTGKRVRKEYTITTKGKQLLKLIKRLVASGPIKEFFKEMGS